MQHLIPIGVAAGCLALALPGGAYSLGGRAALDVLAWWAVLIGLVFGLLPRARVPTGALVAGSALALLSILAALSMLWAGDAGRAFEEAIRPAGYLGLFTLVVLASPARSAPRWLAGLAIGLFAVAVVAVGSRYVPSVFPEQDLATVLPSTRTRLSYPLNYWNGLGATMALACVGLLWLAATARTRLGRAAATGAVCVPVLALFLTSSRGAVGALTVGLVVLLSLVPERGRALAAAAMGGTGAAVLILLGTAREAFVDGDTEAAAASSQGREMLAATVVVVALVMVVRYVAEPALERLRAPRAPRLAVVGVAAVIAVVGIVALEPVQRYEQFKEPPSTASVPARGFVARHLGSAEGNGRYQFWAAGLRAFASAPFLGVGAGSFESWWARKGTLDYYVRDAHSLFVETLAELGIVGALLLLGFVAAAAITGFQARPLRGRSAAVAGGLALLACGVASAAVEWTWEIPAAFAPVVVAAAVLCGPALARARPGAGSRYGFGVATLILGWVAVLAGGIALVGDSKLEASRRAAKDGDLARAAETARDARAVEPWAAAPYLQLALVEERRDLANAVPAVDEAVERGPDDWRAWLTAARIKTKAGDVPGARAALARARALNPRSPLFSP